MPDLDTITLVIVEDHVAVQKGVEALLRPEGIEVLGAATDAEHGYELLLERRPRVALVDVNLPGQSGAWLVWRALVQLPDLAVLLYTGRADSDEVGRALAAGARGVALKAGQPAELIQAIRSVAAGEKYIDPRVEPLISMPDQPEPVASQSSNGGAKASGAWDADAALAEAPEGTPDFLDSLLAVARIELDMELMLVGEFTESGEILRFVQGDAESFGVRKGTELPFDSTYSGTSWPTGSPRPSRTPGPTR